MSNNSSAATEDAWHHLPVYLIYVTLGLVNSAGNLGIVVTIGRYEALRGNKEYNFMMGLSLADCINSGGFLFAGLYRIRLLVAGAHDTLENAWTCMATVHNIFFTNGATLASMMLLVLSWDRLLCVLFPLAYLGWTTTYARLFIGSVYVFNTIGALYAYVSVFGSEVLVSAPCVSPTIFKLTTHPLFAWYFSRSPQLYAVASVGIYIVVVILYKRTNTVHVCEHPNQQYELKRQRKVTITLCVSAICTLVLYVVPYTFGSLANEMGHYTVAIVLWSFSNLNAFANVFIYPLRHREMRQALKALVKRKAMPLDLKAWNNPASQQRPARSTVAPRYKPREARVITTPAKLSRPGLVFHK